MDPEYVIDLFSQNDRLSEDDAELLRGKIEARDDPEIQDVFSLLVELGGVETQKEGLKKFARDYGMEFIDLENFDPDQELIELVDASTAQQYYVFPVERTASGLKLATTEPPNVRASDDLEALLEMQLEFCLADEDELSVLIDEHFSVSIGELTEELEEYDDGMMFVDDTEDAKAEDLEQQAQSAPIIKLVNTIIIEAVNQDTSDIHIEPFEDRLIVRYRIDGVLHKAHEPPKDLLGAVVSRIKIMSDMDIAERRTPQDGRIKLRVMGRELDFRVNCLPTIHGESIVMRVLDKESVSFGLGDLGFLPDNKAIFDQLIRRPHGIILVTGPTGSGKTTTLYSALNEINESDIKLITVEDPVEYQIEGINQMQVEEEIGLDFAMGLRTMLRQNPDVILVGEIRDYETAEIAIRSALTGHLVFSTLHTNDAPSAINRLVDLGVNPYLISSSLQAIMAQRLCRSICEHCKVEYEPEENYLKQVGFPLEDAEETTFYQGEGCDNCNQTGYTGRTAIFELLVNTDDVNDAILKGATSDRIRDLGIEQGMRTLRNDGFVKVKMGETTLMEVARVTQSHGTLAEA